MHRADLTNFPANRDQFVKRRLVDQVARIVLAVPCEIRLKSVRRDHGALQKVEDFRGFLERLLRKFVKFGDKFLDRKLLRKNARGHKSLHSQVYALGEYAHRAIYSTNMQSP